MIHTKRRAPIPGWFLLIALAATALLAAGCARPLPEPGGRNLRVLVIDFENTAGDAPAAQGKALADLVTGVLSNSPRVIALERQDPGRLSDQAASMPLDELGRRAGADYLVIGAVAEMDGNLVVGTRLYSVRGGHVVVNSALTRACREERDLYPLIEGMARAVAGQLRLLAELHDSLARDAAGTGPDPQAVEDEP